MILYIAGVFLTLLLTLVCTWQSFRLLRLRRELQELRNEPTPQIDKPALIVSAVATIFGIACVVLCCLLLSRFLHAATQIYFLWAFLSASQWLIIVSRWDKIVYSPIKMVLCDAAARIAPFSLLSTLLCAVAIPLSSLPLGIQLFYVAVSAWFVVGGIWILRERMIHAGAFEGSEARTRKEGTRRAAMRFAVGYAGALSFCGVANWGIEKGIIPHTDVTWNMVLIIAYACVEIVAAAVASFAYAPPEQRVRVPIANG